MKPVHKIAGLILAAGEGRRMGSPKALLKFANGEGLLRQQVLLLREAGCAKVVVVAGADAGEITTSYGDLDVEWAINKNWRLGQFSSLQIGLSNLQKEDCDGAIVLPVDVVGVNVATICALIETWLRNPHLKAVVPEYEGKGGHPVYLSGELLKIILDSNPHLGGARLDYILKKTNEVICLPVNDPNVLKNINTNKDWG